MRVSDVMTKDVVTVRAGDKIHDAARLMVSHGVSGLPVVSDDGRVIGILSEGDLIVRQREREPRPWWRSFFDSGERLAREYQKAAGTTVAEVMTRAVVCVSPDLPVAACAMVLDQRRIRRLPVVADGRLVGIVSRGDLIKALAAPPAAASGPHADGELAREMRERVDREAWAASRGIVVQAQGGVLALWGLVDSEAERDALETMARGIEGVTGVDSHVVVRADVPYLYWV